jgi:hypothetical protein
MEPKVPTRLWTACFFAASLVWGIGGAHAQSPPSGQSTKAGQTPGKGSETRSGRSGASSTAGQSVGKPKGQAAGSGQTSPRREFSEAYRESLRRTVEKRRELRARRKTGSEAAAPPGAIVPWPMPPALIIRHTPDVHGEVGSFLDILRR